jgi:hypothetical protein
VAVTLTLLMAKVVGGWLLFIAAGALCTLVEVRYAAYRYYFPVAAFWFALLFVASLFNLNDFDDAGAGKLPFLAAVAGAAAGSLGIFLLMERRTARRSKEHQ